GAFSDDRGSSSFGASAGAFAFVAVAFRLAFFGGGASPGFAFTSAGAAASAVGSAGFGSFFSYSSRNRIVLSSDSSRRSATTRNFETNHFSSVLQTSGNWISAVPS